MGVRAFQVLWNRNNPCDPIPTSEMGKFKTEDIPLTLAHLGTSPSRGFAANPMPGSDVTEGPAVRITGGSTVNEHWWDVYLDGVRRCALTIPPNGCARCSLAPVMASTATLTITRTSQGGTTCPAITLEGGAAFAAEGFPACFGSVGTLRLSNSAQIAIETNVPP